MFTQLLTFRSHEVKDEGYEVAHGGLCITVFSAPNYWLVKKSPSTAPGLGVDEGESN